MRWVIVALAVTCAGQARAEFGKRGAWFVAGEVSMSFAASETSAIGETKETGEFDLKLGPRFGWFATDGFAVTLVPAFSYSRTDDGDVEVSTVAAGASAGPMWVLPWSNARAFFFVAPQAGFRFGDMSITDTTGEKDTATDGDITAWSVGGAVGITWAFGGPETGGLVTLQAEYAHVEGEVELGSLDALDVASDELTFGPGVGVYF